MTPASLLLGGSRTVAYNPLSSFGLLATPCGFAPASFSAFTSPSCQQSVHDDLAALRAQLIASQSECDKLRTFVNELKGTNQQYLDLMEEGVSPVPHRAKKMKVDNYDNVQNLREKVCH